MGRLGLAPTDRRGYEAYMEGRVLELGRKGEAQGIGGAVETPAAGLVRGRGELPGETGVVFGRSAGRAAAGVYHSGQAKDAHDEAAASGDWASLGGAGTERCRTGADAQECAGEDGAGLVAAAAHDGAVALGERAIGHGALYAGEPGHYPNPAPAGAKARQLKRLLRRVARNQTAA